MQFNRLRATKTAPQCYMYIEQVRGIVASDAVLVAQCQVEEE